MRTHGVAQGPLARLFVAGLFFASGCTTTLVKDEAPPPRASVVSHCSGSEWADNSSIAVLPIPVVAFFSPHADINKVAAEKFLAHCGDSTRLVKREVEVHRGWCVPAGLTRIITLGIWQWCPTQVSWEADVTDRPMGAAVITPAPGSTVVTPDSGTTVIVPN